MSSILFSLCLLLLVISSTTCQIIAIPLHQGDKIIIETDTPNQYRTLYFDISSTITFREAKHTKVQSSTSKLLKLNTTLPMASSPQIANLTEDVFYLSRNKSTLINYSFFFIETLPSGKEIMGMAYILNNDTPSILHQYKSKQLINRLAFSISITHDKFFKELSLKQQVFLGGVSPSDIESKPKEGVIKVMGRQGRWDCLIKSFGIAGQFEVTTGVYAYFDSVTVFAMIVPQDLFDLIIKTQFKEAIDRKRCRWFNRKGGVACKCKGKEFDGVIRMEIDDYVYEVSMRKMISYDDEEEDCYLEMERNENKEEEALVIGTKYLVNWTMLFDYEEGLIKIYGEDGIVKANTDIDAGMKTIGVIGLEMMILFSGIALLIRIRRYDYNEL